MTTSVSSHLMVSRKLVCKEAPACIRSTRLPANRPFSFLPRPSKSYLAQRRWTAALCCSGQRRTK